VREREREREREETLGIEEKKLICILVVIKKLN
jgi:hypothetical protein